MSKRTCGICGKVETITRLITGDESTDFMLSLPVCIDCAIKCMKGVEQLQREAS